jgi:hypothetical protein
MRVWISGLVVAIGGLWAAQAFAGASASNFQSESRRGTNFWNAPSAIDGNLETAWMVPGNSDNKGEYIMIDVPRSTVDKISMVIGYALDDETFGDYARVKSVKVEAFQYNLEQQLLPISGASAEATFEDRSGVQVVDIDNLELDGDYGGRVKITVTDIYPGQDYPNFAISELLLHLTEMDAAPVISEVSSEQDSHISMDMVDDNPRTFWAGDVEGAMVTFSANGYGLSRVGLQPGPRSYARPKKVEITIGGRSHTTELPDAAQVHWIDVPAVTGYTGSGWGDVQVKILEVYPGTNPQVAIAELDAKATTYEGF